ERLRTGDVMPVERIAAVDDHVIGLQEIGELRHRLVDKRRRQHHPNGAWRRQPGDEVLDRPGPDGAVARKRGDRLRPHVEYYAVVAGAHEPASHASAHT